MKLADYTSQRRASIDLTISYHSAMDLLLALWILGERERNDDFTDLDLGDDWFDDLAAGMSSETADDFATFGSGDVWIGLIALLPDAGEGGRVSDFIDFLKDYDPVDLRMRLSQCYDMFGSGNEELISLAAEGEDGAVDEFLELEAFEKPHMERWKGTLKVLLDMSPDETKDVIIRTLTGFQHDVFEEHERAFRPYLESDFHSKQAMARQMSPERLIEIATSGISMSADHMTRPIVLMPSMVARPWNIVSPGRDFDGYAYPVADENLDLDPDAPPPWLVKVFKALGDERRLRILRKLGGGDASLAELAKDVDIAKSTLHHHMMLLRAAGLVGIHIGDTKQYSLRQDTMSEAAASLDHYIDRTLD